MLEAIPKLKGGKYSGSSYYRHVPPDFPEDFDFPALAKGLLEIRRKLPEEQMPAWFPRYMSEWTKRDSQAAWEHVKFVASDSRRADSAKLSNEFFLTYAATATPAEIGQLIAQLPIAENASLTHFNALLFSAKPETVNALLSSSSQNREEVVENLLQGGFSSSGGNLDTLEDIVLETITPDERRKFIPKILAGLGSSFAMGQGSRIRVQLARLGHTEAEIDAMVPVGKK